MRKNFIEAGIIVCRNIPLIYLNVPKAACTTIKNLLYRLETGGVFERPLAIHRAIRNGLPDAFVSINEGYASFIQKRTLSFTFVRHPLSRIYSCFNEKLYFESPYSFPGLRNKYLPQEYGVQFGSIDEGYSPSQHAENFRRFLLFVRDNISGTTGIRKDKHWLPQAFLVQQYSEHLPIDFIGKVESYETDMGSVLDRLGLSDCRDLLALKFNDGLPAPFTLQQVVTGEIMDLVAEIYADDYAVLDYRRQ